jgi:hypothetical protein
LNQLVLELTRGMVIFWYFSFLLGNSQGGLMLIPDTEDLVIK